MSDIQNLFRTATPEPPATGEWAGKVRDRRRRRRTVTGVAAAVLAVVLTQRTSGDTALGAQVYFWARLAYLPLYAAGIPYVRTLVWAASFWGLLQLLWALF